MRARGGRRLAPAATAGELAALALLVVAVLARPRLGLAAAEPVLAAGFALVLTHRVARQLLAARPLLGRGDSPRRPSPVFFALPLLAYLALVPWSAARRQPDGDEPFYLLITHSLVHDRDADLANDYAGASWRAFMDRPLEPQPGDPVGPRGQRWSRHNELLPMALAPAYAVAGKLGALATMAALAAALAWTTLRLARHYLPDRPGAALAAYALVAFTPPLLLYAHQVWVEVPAALLAMLALDRIRSAGRPWRRRDWLGIALPILLLPLLKIRFMLVALPLLLLAWWRSGRPRGPVLALGALLAAVGGGILVYNHFHFGNPLKIHTLEELEPTRYGALDYVLGGLGLFFDAGFGLFAAAPLWLLLLPAAAVLARHGRPLLADLAVLVLPYLLLVLPRPEWYGGWSPPFRYALVALPLLGVAAASLFDQRRRAGARFLLAGLGALTLVLALLWIAVPGWTYNFAHGRTYLLDHLGERLGADVARLFPSSVRPRPATWLWPLAAAVAVPALWAWRGRRRTAKLAGAAAGVTALLLAAAALPLLAARLPTRTVEIEDPQVEKSGGHLYPELWVVERTRYRGGWVLRVGERLAAPVVPGGRRLRIVLDAEFIRNQPVPFALDVRAGSTHLATWRPACARVRERLELGPFDWPAGAPLVLEAFGPHPPGPLNGVLLDRVVLRWE